MIVVIGGEKGGVGKTTLATNLALMRILMGHDALICDTDAQASANAWVTFRDEAGRVPRVPCVQKYGTQLARQLLDLAERYEDIVVDVGGRDTVELRAALAVADRLFMPVRASQYDVLTLQKMSRLVEEVSAINPDLRACVFINQASANPAVSEVRTARELLGQFPQFRPLDCVLRDRIVFRHTVPDGRGVVEVEPRDAKAVGEIAMLYQEVFDESFAQAPAHAAA